MTRSDRRPRRRLDAQTRRAAILAAAARAFAAAPYEQVSMSVVAADAGASEALVHRYYAGKAGLYAEVVRADLGRLAARAAAANDALPDGVPVRDRVRASLIVFLDHVGERPTRWAAPLLYAGNDPDPVAEVRRQARGASVGRLTALLQPSVAPRHDYALAGFFGFLDAACLEWVRRGCPERDRDPLVESALGALEGALDDWGG